MPTAEQAVQLLIELGLTEYEARCFVALSRVSTATASEVATLSEVPRSRVYDAVERLHRRGLVDIQQSDPREYRAISTDAALESLRNQYTDTLEATDEALSNLQQSSHPDEQGAWAIADHDHVSDRVESFLKEATEEVYVLAADESTFGRSFLDALESASDRDVTVYIEVSSATAEETIRDAVPTAHIANTDLAADPASLAEKRLGRIVMADRQSVLVSGITERDQTASLEETALWASGPDHGLVVGLRHILVSRIDSQPVFSESD
ncbi:TrmB family transcriptional regulator [Natronolimnobius baerhuensis]|uniref:TrmB family transcriptional regulator n=1 Tax=Natronolimnobius baerhuensis TaxID=253108 RepID=A0A202E4V3_9EURY|nr:helix-turn-helix domain-containing protein [Natronolimnobius baerhuensis]OVE83267.1 TrmB family transcriptional regulator [Natronolimnobius baerhuensis]